MTPPGKRSRTFPVWIRRANAAAAHAIAPGVTGLLTKPSLRLSNMFDPIERSSAPSSVVDPRSVIELALVHRLASLLWRLHRASAIETGLFEIQGELLLAGQRDTSHRLSQPGTLRTFPQANGHSKSPGSNGRDHPPAGDQEPLSTPLAPRSKSRAIAQCFLRLSNLDPTLLDRVGSYEASLWRQAAQTIWTLEAMRQPPPPMRQRLRNRAAPFTWDQHR